MELTPFLIVDDQHFSHSSFKLFVTSGKLQPFILEILRRNILEQEYKREMILTLVRNETGSHDFRLEQQLTDPKIFQEWLISNGLDYSTFHKQVAFGFKLEKLKTQVTEPRLQEYFIERKIFLDQVVLSRIAVTEKN